MELYSLCLFRVFQRSMAGKKKRKPRMSRMGTDSPFPFDIRAIRVIRGLAAR